MRKPLNFNAIEKAGFGAAEAEPETDPLTYLNPRGRELLDKLRHFVSRQDLLSFVIEQELSEEGEKRMRKIVLSDVFAHSKKKVAYNRNIVETLQRSLRP